MVGLALPYSFKFLSNMKPDGTPSIDDVMELYEQLQEFEKDMFLQRVYRGGMKTLYGRYDFPHHTYP